MLCNYGKEDENNNNNSMISSDNKSEYKNWDTPFDNTFDNVLNINEIKVERITLSLLTLQITKN